MTHKARALRNQAVHETAQDAYSRAAAAVASTRGSTNASA